MPRKSAPLLAVAVCLFAAPAAHATPTSLVAGDLAGLRIAYRVTPSPDGQRVLIRGAAGDDPVLWSVRTADGTTTRISAASDFVTNTAQSPDGHLVAWSTVAKEDYAAPTVSVRDLSSGATTDLAMPPAVTHRCTNQSGHAILCVGGSVAAIHISPAGRVTALVNEINAFGGAVVLTAAPGASRMTVVADPVLRRARRQRLTLNSSEGAASPDGGVFAVCRGLLHRDGSVARGGLVIVDAHENIRVSTGTAGNVDPTECLASDGGRGLATSFARGGIRRVATIAGAGRRRTIALGRGYPDSISPSGRWLLAAYRRALALYDLRSGHKVRTIRLTRSVGSAQWSPDEHTVTLDDMAVADLRRGKVAPLQVPKRSLSSFTSCFTAAGRILVARETDVPVSQAADLFTVGADGAGAAKISGAPDLSPLFAPSDCRGVPSGGSQRIFFVAGDTPALYSVAADGLDGSELTPPSG